jgi:hypothetical protein
MDFVVGRRRHFCGLLHVLAFCDVRHFLSYLSPKPLIAAATSHNPKPNAPAPTK